MIIEKVGADSSEVNERCGRGTVEVAHEPAGYVRMRVRAVKKRRFRNKYRSVVIISLVQVRASDVKVLKMKIALCSKCEEEADCGFLSHEVATRIGSKRTSGGMRSPRRAHRDFRVTMSPSALHL